MALLRWLNSQTEEDRRILAAVTGVQVGRELLNRITGQDKVDAYKVQRGAPITSATLLASHFLTMNVVLFCVLSETVS